MEKKPFFKLQVHELREQIGHYDFIQETRNLKSLLFDFGLHLLTFCRGVFSAYFPNFYSSTKTS